MYRIKDVARDISANDDPDTIPSSAEDTTTEILQELLEDIVAGDTDDCPDTGADHTGIVERLRSHRQDPHCPTLASIAFIKTNGPRACMQQSDAFKHDDEASRPWA